MYLRSRKSNVPLTASSTMTSAGLSTLFEYHRIATGVMMDEKPYPTAPLMTAAPEATTASQIAVNGSDIADLPRSGPAVELRPLSGRDAEPRGVRVRAAHRGRPKLACC